MNSKKNALNKNTYIPVIDLFAGPGGLGEGFSAYSNTDGNRPFDIRLSIEKDPYAHMTLQLRSFIRQFSSPPPEYYKLLADTSSPLGKRVNDLFNLYPDESENAVFEAWNAELGKKGASRVRERIVDVLNKTEPWVLIGGPPCQAYSIAGRSRNKGKSNYIADKDEKQFLYLEYLQIIAEHRPTVFVMENVKGLLSATIKNQKIFERICSDLNNPIKALKREGRIIHVDDQGSVPSRYRIYSLVTQKTGGNGFLQNFVVPMERFGIPQKRHRLILLGIREDFCSMSNPSTLDFKEEVSAIDVLDGLPKVRSGLSRAKDGSKEWVEHINKAVSRAWLQDNDEPVVQLMMKILDEFDSLESDRGGEFVKYPSTIKYKPDWYLDPRTEGVFNHTTRAHMGSDLYRYFFAACYGSIYGRSPVLSEFPMDLLPLHKNVGEALQGGFFDDRFRVQVADKPATTVTSHLAKDGHSFIHYDPLQCRSLTVREVARLQTFPDNYFFCGPRTSQYVQVGNAVPPLLSKQIARIVMKFLRDAGAVD